ncbi:MAG TPA: hypothetical protein VGD19_11950 [Allosphingosinicella sp.]|jgi:hypothetical protein
MRASSALPFLALLGGCASAGGDFPSLAPRAVERELAAERPARAAPVVPDDPALAARLAELIGQARQGDAAFEAALESARPAAAGAGAAGSEGWIAAQMQISRVEAARVATVNALAELDRLGIARAGQPTSAADRAAVNAAVADVQAMTDRQHERLESLRASLSPG